MAVATWWSSGHSRPSGNWDLYRRSYTPAKGEEPGRWSEIVRLTDDPGSDSHAVATTDAKGTVWVAWQAWRDDNYEILVMSLTDGARPRTLSSSPANDWSPAIAADGKGNVFVAWDTYERGNYDVRLRSTAEGATTVEVASSNRFEARPSLACDAAGRVWIAYEEGDENWGKDYANATPAKVPVQPARIPALPRAHGSGEVPRCRWHAQAGPRLARGRPARRPPARQELPAAGRR